MADNFSFLKTKFPILAKFGTLAEQYLYSDSNSCLIKLRMLGETIVNLIFGYEKISVDPELNAAKRIKTLEDEGIRNTQAFVALTGNAETNILACLTAKKLGVRKTVAMVENLDYVSMAESLDIGTIINKKNIAASHIFQMMLDAEVSNMRSLMMVDSDVAEFTAAEGSKVTKKPVKDLGLPFGVTIGGLVRNEKGYLVNGNTQVMAGDSVMVFCHEHNLKKVEKFFKASSLW